MRLFLENFRPIMQLNMPFSIFFTDLKLTIQSNWFSGYLLFMFRVCHTVLSVHCSLVVIGWKRANLLVLLYVMFSCVFVISPMVSWVSCGTWLYRFLIFAFFLTLLERNQEELLWKKTKIRSSVWCDQDWQKRPRHGHLQNLEKTNAPRKPRNVKESNWFIYADSRHGQVWVYR